MDYKIRSDIKNLLKNSRPVVAMESTLFVHGLPKESSINLFNELNEIAKKERVSLAIIAILKGVLKIGLVTEEMIELIEKGSLNLINKVGLRDIPVNLALKKDAATTISSTLWAAERAGITILSTGGIGGVHRGFPENIDISVDLYALSRHNLIVVCSGPKAFLDIRNTFELLESLSVPIVGYKNFNFPTFFCGVDKNIKLKYVVKNPKEAANIYSKMRNLEIRQSLLVTNPVPKKYELDKNLSEEMINKLLKLAKRNGLKGPEVTPFILSNLVKLTEGKSLKANLVLIKENFKLACRISKEL